jgi:hypothetical protein
MNFPLNSLMLQSGNLQLFLLESEDVSVELLDHIGRARSRAYSSMIKDPSYIDIDDFDKTYKQLVLWDIVEKRIVGGYRFFVTDEIKSKSNEELYLSTLYDIKPEFFEKFGPIIELGRSFVDPTYQKTSFAFPLLWKGIKHFSDNNPRYKYFIGAITINKNYNNLSKKIITDYVCSLENPDAASSYLQAKFPVPSCDVINQKIKEVYQTFGKPKTLLEFETMIRHVQEDKRSIPTILKYYIKYSHINFLCAGMDPYFDNIIDVVIISPIQEASSSVSGMINNRFDDLLLAS